MSELEQMVREADEIIEDAAKRGLVIDPAALKRLFRERVQRGLLSRAAPVPAPPPGGADWREKYDHLAGRVLFFCAVTGDEQTPEQAIESHFAADVRRHAAPLTDAELGAVRALAAAPPVPPAPAPGEDASPGGAVREAIAAMERAVIRVGLPCHHNDRPAWRADLLTAIDGLRALAAPSRSGAPADPGVGTLEEIAASLYAGPACPHNPQEETTPIDCFECVMAALGRARALAAPSRSADPGVMAERVASALERLIDELDDVNGWLPTALQPQGVAYEEAREAVAAWRVLSPEAGGGTGGES